MVIDAWLEIRQRSQSSSVLGIGDNHAMLDWNLVVCYGEGMGGGRSKKGE